ncbi:MAG: hypothetical protein ACYDHN_13360 [Solirubrobacteraceae bacterium]
MSTARRTALVALFAVLGIVLAAAVTWGTSQLVRQRIGLASEPLTAGSRLLATPPSGSLGTSPTGASRTSSTPGEAHGERTTTASSTSSTSSAPSAPTSAPSTSTPTSGSEGSEPTSEADRERGEGESPSKRSGRLDGSGSRRDD